MASDTDSADVTELTERNEDSGLSGVDKWKEIDVLLIQIKSRKRTAKTKVTKLRHELERLCVKDSKVKPWSNGLASSGKLNFRRYLR